MYVCMYVCMYVGHMYVYMCVRACVRACIIKIMILGVSHTVLIVFCNIIHIGSIYLEPHVICVNHNIQIFCA